MGWRIIEAGKLAETMIGEMIRADPYVSKLEVGSWARTKYYRMNPFNIWGPSLGNAVISYMHTEAGIGKSTQSNDVGNEPSNEKGKMIGNFSVRYPIDGLHSLRYRLDKIVKSPLFTTVFVDFKREWDQKNEDIQPVTLLDDVKRHPCLQSLDWLVACYNKIW